MRDWDSLRYVLAIARAGGLSGAARDLGVTHATVSRQLDKAEAAAGLQLFSRRPSGLEPTAAGQDAITRAAAIEAEVLALEMSLSARDAAGTGPLTVTVAPLISTCGFAGDVAVFAAAHPGVDLTVLASNDTLNIHRREADIAVRVSRTPSDSLWGRVIARQRAGWFATPAFIEKHRAGLAGQGGAVPILSFSSWTQPVPPGLARQVPGAHAAVVCDDMVSAVALAETGLVMVRMAHFLSAAHPGLVRVPHLPLIDYMPIWCLTHPDLRRVARVAAFMRLLAERFATRQTLFMGPDGPGP